jgi:hypothetical protein
MEDALWYVGSLNAIKSILGHLKSILRILVVDKSNLECVAAAALFFSVEN